MNYGEAYRSIDALNYSRLAQFYQSPDHALMEFGEKSYFEYGKAFELLIEDAAKCTQKFEEKYYYSNIDGVLPDEILLILKKNDCLSLYQVLNKDGSRSAAAKTLHLYIDELSYNPGKIPISKSDTEMLKIHVDNMLKMEYEGVKVEKLLSYAEFQKTVFWESDGIEKKALLDIFIQLGNESFIFDLKTTASFPKFYGDLSRRVFLQELHYTEGVNKTIGDCYKMPFFVASKEKPYLCQPVVAEYPDIEEAQKKYKKLCQDFDKWDGKTKGYLLEKKCNRPTG